MRSPEEVDPVLQLRYPDVISGPPRPSAIIRRVGLAAGVERYVVPGGGALLVEVDAGDRIGVLNAEGGQACELVALDRNGRSDPGILDVASNSNAAGLKALLLSGDGNLRQFRAKLERRGIDLGGAKAVRIFGAATPAGTEESFTAQRSGSLVVAAPGGPMSV
ncbi:MAG: aminomethyltransferase, partial [Hyphomicrobiales bacterium]|nr:aminomethyltransferase [Hyphomicrobiales bacterium]